MYISSLRLDTLTLCTFFQFTATGLMIIARNYLDVYPYDKWNAKVTSQFLGFLILYNNGFFSEYMKDLYKLQIKGEMILRVYYMKQFEPNKTTYTLQGSFHSCYL